MKWRFIRSGLWAWDSNSGIKMGLLYFIEGISWRFWTLSIQEFKIFCKTHDKAIEAGKIIQNHMIAARKELLDKKLIIPVENMSSALMFRSCCELDSVLVEYSHFKGNDEI